MRDCIDINIKTLGITIIISEVDDHQVIDLTDKRFEIAVMYEGKRFFPKLKNKYMKFEENDYIYTIIDERDDRKIKHEVSQELWVKLQIFNRTYADCQNELAGMIIMKIDNLKTVLKEKYNINLN